MFPLVHGCSVSAMDQFRHCIYQERHALALVTTLDPKHFNYIFILYPRFEKGFGSLEKLREQVVEMKTIISDLNAPLVLSHNDTLSRNIIYYEATGESINYH